MGEEEPRWAQRIRRETARMEGPRRTTEDRTPKPLHLKIGPDTDFGVIYGRIVFGGKERQVTLQGGNKDGVSTKKLAPPYTWCWVQFDHSVLLRLDRGESGAECVAPVSGTEKKVQLRIKKNADGTAEAMVSERIEVF